MGFPWPLVGSARLSVVFLDEIDQGGVHLFGMRGTQEVLPALHRDQLRIGRVLEQLDFSFRVGDGVYGVVRSLHVVSVRDSSPPPSPSPGRCLRVAT